MERRGSPATPAPAGTRGQRRLRFCEPGQLLEPQSAVPAADRVRGKEGGPSAPFSPPRGPAGRYRSPAAGTGLWRSAAGGRGRGPAGPALGTRAALPLPRVGTGLLGCPRSSTAQVFNSFCSFCSAGLAQGVPEGTRRARRRRLDLLSAGKWAKTGPSDHLSYTLL